MVRILRRTFLNAFGFGGFGLIAFGWRRLAANWMLVLQIACMDLLSRHWRGGVLLVYVACCISSIGL